MGKGILVAAALGVVAVLLWMRFGVEGDRGLAGEPPSVASQPEEGDAPRDEGLAAPPTVAGEEERVGVELAPDAVLVLVHDPKGRPIADALVRRWLDETPSDLRTGADGTCTLAGARDAML